VKSQWRQIVDNFVKHSNDISLSEFPMPITEAYNPTTLTMNYHDLLIESEKVFESLKVYVISCSYTIFNVCITILFLVSLLFVAVINPYSVF